MAKHAHLTTIPKLIRIIKKERVDIVSTHSSVDSWAGGIAAKLTGRCLVRFRHNLYPVGKDPLTKLIYKMPDNIIAISDAVNDKLINHGLKGNKISVIPSSVDINIYNPEVGDLRNELKISSDTTVIGNTSGFTGVKGQKYLLQGLNILSEKFPCILLFAGRLNEPFKSKYLSHVREELRDKVIFLGHRDDIPRVLKTIDIFISPSVVEGLGMALLEAMAMEKPVVVSDITTFKEFITDKVNGLYFRVKDSEDLAEKVLYIKENGSLKTQIAKNARYTILEKFSLENMLDQTETLYKKVFNA